MLNPLLSIVGRRLNGVLCLLELILNGLAIGRSQVMFSPAVNIQQIYKIFPTLIEGLQVHRNFLAGGELLVVRINLVLHPAEVFDGLTFARIETLDYCFALRLTKLARALLGSAFDQAAIKRRGRHDSKVESFGSEPQQKRRYILKED